MGSGPHHYLVTTGNSKSPHHMMGPSIPGAQSMGSAVPHRPWKSEGDVMGQMGLPSNSTVGTFLQAPSPLSWLGQDSLHPCPQGLPQALHSSPSCFRPYETTSHPRDHVPAPWPQKGSRGLDKDWAGPSEDSFFSAGWPVCPELHHGGYQYAPWESARADRAPDTMPALRLQGQADQVVAQGRQRPVHTHAGEASPRKRGVRQ